MTRTIYRLSAAAAIFLLAMSAANAQDAKTKAALDAIKGKTSQIKEFTCVVDQVERTSKGEIISSEEQGYRSPDHFYLKKTITKHLIPTLIGKYHVISDGKQLALYTAHPAGSGDFYMGEKFQKLPEAERMRLKSEHETPKIAKYDFARLKQAGVTPDSAMFEMIGGLSIRPMQFFQDIAPAVDMNSMQLKSEDGDNWRFECATGANSPGGDEKLQIVVAKQDGLVRQVSIRDTNVFTVKDIRLNPGLQDKVFDTTPPAGVQVADKTDELIQSTKNGTRK